MLPKTCPAAAAAKHFLADGATIDGIDRGNAELGDEELQAMHLPSFIDAIDADVVSIMASFSSLNGEQIHGSKGILSDLLKDTLGFDGAAGDLVLDPAQRALIETHHDAGKTVITVLITGRPLLVNEALASSDAFVVAWLSDSQGAGIADVFFGDHPFGGKLSFSWPREANQIPLHVGDEAYDPLFEFGFGLTY